MPPIPKPDAVRFWLKVQKTDGCWLWTAATTSTGYGRFRSAAEGRVVKAHRWAYESSRGPLPDGLELDHLCRNRACVRPEHLEPVTHQENLLRGASPVGVNARQTTCAHGHPLVGDNVYPQHKGQAVRRCKTCTRARLREAHQRRLQKRAMVAPDG